MQSHVKVCQHSKAEKPLTCGNTVPEVGLEPTHLSIPHFECGASANSATRARRYGEQTSTPTADCEQRDRFTYAELLYIQIG